MEETKEQINSTKVYDVRRQCANCGNVIEDYMDGLYNDELFCFNCAVSINELPDLKD